MSIADFIETCTKQIENTNILYCLIPPIVSVLGIVLAYWQLNIYLKMLRSEHIRKVQNLICFDKDVMEIIYKIQKDEEVFEAICSDDEIMYEMNKYLSHLNYACYLNYKKLLRKDEFKFIEYYIVIALNSNAVQITLQSLCAYAEKNKCITPYEHLIKYGKTNKLLAL